MPGAGRRGSVPVRRAGARSFADNPGLSRGIVAGRAVPSLRSPEIHPLTLASVPPWSRTGRGGPRSRTVPPRGGVPRRGPAAGGLCGGEWDAPCRPAEKGGEGEMAALPKKSPPLHATPLPRAGPFLGGEEAQARVVPEHIVWGSLVGSARKGQGGRSSDGGQGAGSARRRSLALAGGRPGASVSWRRCAIVSRQPGA